MRIALAYFDAWTRNYLDRAMRLIADVVVCDAPAGRIQGAAAYRTFLAAVLENLRGTHIVAAFGNDETAVIM